MRPGLVPAVLAALGYALLELAFFARRNLLLPWEAEHVFLGLMFFVVHGVVALAALFAAGLLTRRLAPSLANSLPALAPIATLVLVHALSHYRERVNARPRDVEGSLVTIGIVVAIVAATIVAAYLIRGSSKRASAAATTLSLAIVAAGALRVLTAAPVGGVAATTPRPEDDRLAAVDTGQRVLLLGVDGASWDILDPLMKEGRLPNFAALVARGRTLRLESIRPTFSPVIWTSVATGTDRFRHGIHDVVQTTLPGGTTLRRSMDRTAFLTKVAARSLHLVHRAGLTRVTPYRSDQVGATSVFEAASEAGLSTSRVEWYVSWPSRGLSGLDVSDRFHLQDPTGEPMAGVVAPAALGPVLLDHVVTAEDVALDRVLDLVDTAGMTPAEVSRWARDHSRFVTEMRHNLARDLTTRDIAVDLLSRDDEWRLFGVYFRAVDLSHHLTWPRRHAPGDPLGTVIDRYHELSDEIVGDVLAEVPEDAVIVMLSDHGFEDRYAHARAPDGFAIMAGSPIVRGESAASRAVIGVYDIAPTIAALLGLPVAEDLAGRPRLDFLDPAFVAENPVRSVSTWKREGGKTLPSVDDDHSVEEAELERLRALGYIQ
jgi:hypothetical protein